MLILTRKPGELFRIEPEPTLNPETPICEIFAGGPIEVIVTRVSGSQVDLGIIAHPRLSILRQELVGQPRATKKGANADAETKENKHDE